MARTINEISQVIKEAFIADEVLREAYSLKTGKSFDQQFSKVSLEYRLVYVFASVVWGLEKLWDLFRVETDRQIDKSYVTSLPWYYTKALEFQNGDKLVFDEKTYSFKYPAVDDKKQVVKNVAVRQVTENGVTKLKIYFSDKDKQPLKGDLRNSFETYMREIGAAGTHYLFVSEAPDALRVHLQVYYDPLVLDSMGQRLEGGGKPVEETVETYLNSLEYGGTFYASKLVDMLQVTTGVKDVVLEGTTWKGEKANRRRIDADSGAFVYVKTEGDIVYSID
nr:MAG TPA: Baseplate structural protein [Caudoviricetes sp.]